MLSEKLKEKIVRFKKNNLTVLDNLHQVKIELSKGCNRSCGFCGIPTSIKGLMDKKTFLNILKELHPGKTKRVEFILHGEPTLNPNIYDFSKLVREKLPEASISLLTNTDIFKRKGFDRFLDLFRNGVNQIQADLYDEEQSDWFFENLQIYKKDMETLGIDIYDYYKDRINPFHFRGNKKILIITKEWEGLNNSYICTRNFHTFGGNIPYEKWSKFSEGKVTISSFPMRKVCTEPLKYASVFYNGTIGLCCRDGSMSINLGNVNNESLLDVWHGEKYQIVRLLLKLGKRELLLPCILCNMRSFRFGLYPYWGEKYSLEKCISILKEITIFRKEEAIFENIITASKFMKIPEYLQDLIEENLSIGE